MNLDSLILIIINLFVTLSSFFLFYIKLIERITRVEVLLEHYIKTFNNSGLNNRKDIF